MITVNFEKTRATIKQGRCGINTVNWKGTSGIRWWDVLAKFLGENVDEPYVVKLLGERTRSCVGVGIDAENEHLARFDTLSKETNQVFIKLFDGVALVVF